MNDNEEGLAILNNVLGTEAIIATDTETHLGTYGAALMNILGFQANTVTHSQMELKQVQ